MSRCSSGRAAHSFQIRVRLLLQTPERQNSLRWRLTLHDHHEAEYSVGRSARGEALAGFFALHDPIGVGARVLLHIWTQRRQDPGSKKHPFHAGNLVDITMTLRCALAQMSVDLSRCARGFIGPPAHGTGALESVPGSHHGVGRAGGRAPRSTVPGVARQHERPPPPGLRDPRTV